VGRIQREKCEGKKGIEAIMADQLLSGRSTFVAPTSPIWKNILPNIALQMRNIVEQTENVARQMRNIVEQTENIG
jgi:hypothetical protein